MRFQERAIVAQILRIFRFGYGIACEQENWSITDNGIEDVESWKNGKKLDEPIAWIEIECDDCGRTNYLKVPYSDILTLLRKYASGWDELNIDEDRWSE